MSQLQNQNSKDKSLQNVAYEYSNTFCSDGSCSVVAFFLKWWISNVKQLNYILDSET